MCTQNALKVTSISLQHFLLLPALHVSHLATAINHLLSCPINDVAADHVTALEHISAGRHTIVYLLLFSEL